MADTNEFEYKLIHAVDPTKIKVSIKDKFAKLTLSSNKKKQLQQQQENSDKRHSASRNILNMLCSADQVLHAGAVDTQSTASYVNPLLRSDSTKSDPINQEHTDMRSITIDENVTNLIELECSDFMEPLRFSGEDVRSQKINQDIETISQHFSNLLTEPNDTDENSHAIDTEEIRTQQQYKNENIQIRSQPKRSICISLTSEEGESVNNDDVITNEQMQRDIETISQKVSNLLVTNDETIDNSFTSENCVKEAQITSKNNNSINISMTSEEDRNEETDNDDVLCITISDSTVSEYKDATDDFDIMTSNISEPSKTTNGAAHLPNSLSNEKADRIAAFLRDVSIERREMLQRDVELDVKDTRNLSKQLASADTESMSEDSADKIEKQITLDDTAPMTQPHSSFFVHERQRLSIPAHVNVDADDATAKRLAHNDTECNTLSSFTLSNHSTPTKNNDINNISANQIVQTPNDSIVIPETSSECEILDDTPNVSAASPTKHKSATETAQSSPGEAAGMEQVQMSLASINISAKISIKIQFSQMDIASSNDSTDEENQAASQQPISSLPTSENCATNSEHYSGEKNESESCNKRTELKMTKPSQNGTQYGESEVIEDGNFLTQAEKLLNELYGKTWQTPDVIRTLKRASGSGSKQQRQENINESRSVNRHSNEINANRKNSAPVAEESMLDEFSIFRRNIVKTNLDSTRLQTPSHVKQPIRQPQITTTMPRSYKQRTVIESIETPKTDVHQIPQTEIRKRLPAVAKVIRTTRPKANDRWRLLVDEDSDSTDGVNASDDDYIDCTVVSDDSSTSSYKENSNICKITDTDDEDQRNRKCRTDIKKLNARDRLDDVLRTCRPVTKSKLLATPSSGHIDKPKRKLFNPQENYEIGGDIEAFIERVRTCANDDPEMMQDLENMYPRGTPIHKRLQTDKTEKPKASRPIFNVITPKKETPKPATTKSNVLQTKTPKTPKTKTRLFELDNEKCNNSQRHYGFLKSLDACVNAKYGHPDAVFYRDNYRTKKEELAQKLYEMFNKQLFDNKLDVPLIWNKKLTRTAGKCVNRKRISVRLSTVELSEKVLTSADRLRCTLIHELCHAATWIISNEMGGHGKIWKSWAQRANKTFPDLPKIGVCHQYEIEYKYTYKCIICGSKSQAHSKSRKVDEIRCAKCHGKIEILLNKKDKDGNIMLTPCREPTGFAKFVKDNYQKYKAPDKNHAEVMKILSNEFATLKVSAGN